MNHLPFEEAREFVSKLGLKSSQEWNEYCKSGKKPANIPSSAPRTYVRQWNGWSDWLGTVTLAERTFRPFDDAKNYAKSLGFNNRKQWHEYARAGNIPDDVPVNPQWSYRQEWKGWGDWLGSLSIRPADRTFRPFKKARLHVHKLGIRNKEEWGSYCKSKDKPVDIPALPPRTYMKDWKGWGDWLGTGTIAPQNRKFRTFNEARKLTHSLGLSGQSQWRIFCKSGNKPDDIPNNPERPYKKDWKGWGDWLGTGFIATHDREYRPFEEARAFANSLGLNSSSEWQQFCTSGRKPDDIPNNPERPYKKDWKGWGDWLGTGRIANFQRKYLSFKEARAYAHSLNLKSSSEWQQFCKSGKKPVDVPYEPNETYEVDWMGWGDWLGTVTTREIVFRPIEEAREFVRSLRLKNRDEFAKYCKSEVRPKDIPTQPSRTYGKLWKGWGDWLGTGTIATWQREYLPFEEAKEFVQSLGFQRREEWDDYVVSEKKPNNIPAGPWNVYKKEWSGIFDWLGYEEKLWSVGKVKELLRNLIKSGAIYNWDEAVLYSFLLRKGLLNLSDRNRHKDFFKTLIEMARTHDGRAQLEEYVNSSPKIAPPILSVQEAGKLSGQEEEIPLASNRDLANIGDESPLDYSNNRSVEQILQQTTILESINVDEEAMQFYVKYSIDELWKLAFIAEKK